MSVSDRLLQCRQMWTRRIHSSKRTDVRAVHARICIRKECPDGPSPSTDTIHKWLENDPERRQGIKAADIYAALNSGEEVGLRH